MNKCIFYTMAYNAEKTIRRAINSILAQTCDKWVYYIVDNGSEDDTGKIIQEYASSDSRIIPLANKINQVWEPENGIGNIIFSRHPDDKFSCWLDADDEYLPDFLEKMAAYMLVNNLDLAACCTQFISAQTGQPMNSHYSIPGDLLLVDDGFAKHFPDYYKFMHTIWGKLYSISLLKKCSFRNPKGMSYGADSAFTVEAFSYAEKAGILGITLHKYYVSPESVSYKYDDRRVVSNQLFCDIGFEYLQKRNALSYGNENQIFAVYAGLVKRTIDCIINAQIPPIKKLSEIRNVFVHPYTQKILYGENIIRSADFRELLQTNVQTFVLSLPEARAGAGFEAAVDAFAAMRDIYVTPDWPDNDGEALMFLKAVRSKRERKGNY